MGTHMFSWRNNKISILLIEESILPRAMSLCYCLLFFHENVYYGTHLILKVPITIVVCFVICL